jgi:nucleoside-diphosphate-sugar epimerase
VKVVITGAAGFLGRRLAARLLAGGALSGADGAKSGLSYLVLFDVAKPEPPADTGKVRVDCVSGDITDPAQVRALIDTGTDGVFHLAGVMSGAAEGDFDLGMRVNLDGTRHLLEACRAIGRSPRFVFTSSLAIYGGEKVCDDRTPVTPMNSYGVQKTICEHLVNDYTRRGFVDGRALRLPTIAVRPGRPNAAASSFVSSIIREPLTGQTTTCPVPPDAYMPIMSPRRVLDALVHAFELDGASLGPNRVLLLPGLNPTVGEMVEEMRRIAGNRVADRVVWKVDPQIHAIVQTWPHRLVAKRAASLGFEGDASVGELIKQFIDDELGGRFEA